MSDTSAQLAALVAGRDRAQAKIREIENEQRQVRVDVETASSALAELERQALGVEKSESNRPPAGRGDAQQCAGEAGRAVA